MNVKFFQQTFVVLSLTTLTVVASRLSAQAQTANQAANTKEAKVVNSAAALKTKPSANVVAQTQPNYPTIEPSVPTNQPNYPTTEPSAPTNTPETTPTQPPRGDIAPGRATRGGASYIGIGGNIGLGGGETALGLGNFTVLSKVGLTNAISARPSIVIGDSTAILIPVTYDFNLQSTGAETQEISAFSPYVGGGLAITTGNNSDVGPMLTAGVDVPVARQITVNAGVNAGFFDEVSVGLAIGVGYNFAGF